MVPDDQPAQPTPQRPPIVRLAKGQEVSLGCGTLILIAVIVAIFSSKSNVDLSPVQSRLNDMDQKLQRLEQQPVLSKLNDMDQRLQRLEQTPGIMILSRLNALDQRLQRLEQKLDQLDKKVKP
jgi:hypothetical protein